MKRLFRVMGKLGIVGLFVVDRRRGREEERRSWVEIGRDAAAFFSDLNFRFLLMHYIQNMEKENAFAFTSLSLFLWVFDLIGFRFGFGFGFGD